MSSQDVAGKRDGFPLTVVVPTCNRPELLQEALNSLIQQTRRDFQIIVVDDGSDPAAEISASTAKGGIELRLVRHDSSLGGYNAKNAGVAAASGRVVTFLDDDDLVAPNFVERIVANFEQNLDLEVLFIPVTTFGKDAEFFQRGCDEAVERLILAARGQASRELVWLNQEVVPSLLAGVPMALQRPAFRRDAFSRIGGFQPCKTMWECEWAIRAVSRLRTAMLRERLHLWRVDGQGYFTNGPRALDQAEANVQIKRRLYVDCPALVPPEREIWFREGLADALYTLAYQRLGIQNAATASCLAWLESMKIQFRWRGLLLLPRIIGCAVSRGFRLLTLQF